MEAYELTGTDGSKVFVLTNMSEEVLGEQVWDHKSENNGTFEIEPFIESVKRKGVYKIEKAKNQNPNIYQDQDQVTRQMMEN